MNEISEVAKKLTKMREDSGLSIEVMAKETGYASSTGYFHYESRFKKEFLPLDFVLKLARIFSKHNIPRKDVLALAGIDISILDDGVLDTRILANILETIRTAAKALDVEIDCTQEAQAISQVYEVAMQKKGTTTIGSETESILRYIKRNQPS